MMTLEQQRVDTKTRLLLLACRQAAIIVANAITRYLALPKAHCEHCGAEADKHN